VKTKTATTSKLADCGLQCMIVWFSEQHKADVTCDIIWLNQMLFTKKVDEVEAFPDGIKANVKTAAPEYGKSSKEDGADEDNDGSNESDGDKDGTWVDIDN
jgi:hypothetical protein